MVQVSREFLEELVRRIGALELTIERLKSMEYSPYKGTKGSDFTTTDLPYHGDYGYQTADSEIQVNCNGTVRAITTAAL